MQFSVGEIASFFLIYRQLRAQRKTPVDLHFLHHRHKAGIESDKQTVRWTFAAIGSPWDGNLNTFTFAVDGQIAVHHLGYSSVQLLHKLPENEQNSDSCTLFKPIRGTAIIIYLT